MARRDPAQHLAGAPVEFRLQNLAPEHDRLAACLRGTRELAEKADLPPGTRVLHIASDSFGEFLDLSALREIVATLESSVNGSRRVSDHRPRSICPGDFAALVRSPRS